MDPFASIQSQSRCAFDAGVLPTHPKAQLSRVDHETNWNSNVPVFTLKCAQAVGLFVPCTVVSQLLPFKANRGELCNPLVGASARPCKSCNGVVG